MDGHPAQVDEAILLGHELQALHLVLDLYLALEDEARHLSVASSQVCALLSHFCPFRGALSLLDNSSFLEDTPFSWPCSHLACFLGWWLDRPGTNPALLPPG